MSEPYPHDSFDHVRVINFSIRLQVLKIFIHHNIFYGQLAVKTIKYIGHIDVVPGFRAAEYHLDVLCLISLFPRIGYTLTTPLLR